MTRLRTPAAAALTLLLVACADPQAPHPSLDTLAPPVAEAGRSGWIAIHGQSFEPLYTAADGGGAVEVDTAYRVQVGGLEAEEVRWVDAGRLLARLPAEVPVGDLDVTVISPFGERESLPGALCAGERESRAFVHVCLQGPLESLTFAHLCVTDDAAREDEPRVVLSHALIDLVSGPAVSADGATVAALRARRVDGENVADVVVLRPFDAGFTRDAATILRTRPIANLEDSPFSMPVLTRDSGTVLFVEEGRRILAQPMPDDSGSVTDPVILYEEPGGSDHVVGHLDVDPAGRHVVFTRSLALPPVCPDPEGKDPVERHALWWVSLEGGDAAPLLDEIVSGGSHGPAVHLPSGDALLFASNRLGLTLPLDDGCLHEVVNFYRLDLGTGAIAPATVPTTMAPLGPPVMSPDGRWAAVQGLLVDGDRLSVDILLVDLSAGQVIRAYRPESTCVNPLRPWTCAFLSLGPAFAPDGTSLIASGITTEGSTLPRGFLYEVALPDTLPDLPAYDRTLSRDQVTFFAEGGLAPGPRDGYRGCAAER